MKYAVVYASKTRHSRKIAQAVAEALGTEAQDVKTAPRLAGVDLLLVVGGIYAGKSDPALVSWLSGLDPAQVAKVALMESCTSPKPYGQPELRTALAARGIPVLEEAFHCRGSFLFFAMGRPNREEIASAVRFARRVAGLSEQG